MAWNDFYMQTTGADLNSGSTNGDAASLTYAGGTFVRATGVFVPASGDPAADGVTTSDWVSIYTTSGATGATFVAKVTARDAVSITVDVTTAKIGVATNVSETAAATTLKVGGAWASGVVVTTLFVAQTMTANARVNVKAGTYTNTTTNRTWAATASTLLPIWFRGYKTTPGDLDDGITLARSLQDGVNLPLWTFTTGVFSISGIHHIFSNFDVTSAVTGSSTGGINIGGAHNRLILCRVENTANNANSSAVRLPTTDCVLVGCRLKAHTGATSCLNLPSTSQINGCVIIGGATGILSTGGFGSHIDHCVISGFATTGIAIAAATVPMFVHDNTIYAAATNGILISTVATTAGYYIYNNRIGGCTNGINQNTGTDSNTVTVFRNTFYSCTNNLVGITEMGTVGSDLGILCRLIDNDTDQWVDKASGDFSLISGALDEAFPGVFEGQTAMVGHADLGAVARAVAAAGGRPEFRGSNL